MGCSGSNLEQINYDVLNPPIRAKIKNKRLKTDFFPQGEIYYLRNYQQLKENSVPSVGGEGLLSYDNIVVELSISYKFVKEEMMHEFVGSSIKIFTSDLTIDNQLAYVGRTEKFIDNNLEFRKKFKVYYCFQKSQEVKIEIELGDNIQVVNTLLGKIIGSKNLEIELPFFYKGTNKTCSVVLKGTVIKDENKNSFITLNLITDLNALPFSDYFVIISNWNHPRRPQKVWKSNEISGKQFKFQAQMITLQDLCLGEKNRRITFEFYGVYCGKIGQAERTLGQLDEAMANKTKIPITVENVDLDEENSDKVKLNYQGLVEGQEIGYFYIEYGIEKISRFIDLVEQGLQIRISFAIDYTGSNLKYTDPKSLHYIGDEDNPNPYEKLLRVIGDLVACYDFKEDFPLLGFGGIIPSTGETSHCFPVSLTNQEFVHGIDEAIKKYRESLTQVILDGPTYFYPIFKENLHLIKSDETETSVYHLLVIITDGTIHDFDDIKRGLIKNENYALSVAIIGVGDENFRDMLQLDCQTMPLEDKNGNKCNRDLCQFVRYKDFRDRPEKLAERLLMIIPTQIEQYFRVHQNFVGLSDTGKYKNIYLRKLAEEKEKEKKRKELERQKSKLSKNKTKSNHGDDASSNLGKKKSLLNASTMKSQSGLVKDLSTSGKPKNNEEIDFNQNSPNKLIDDQ